MRRRLFFRMVLNHFFPAFPSGRVRSIRWSGNWLIPARRRSEGPGWTAERAISSRCSIIPETCSRWKAAPFSTVSLSGRDAPADCLRKFPDSLAAMSRRRCARCGERAGGNFMAAGKVEWKKRFFPYSITGYGEDGVFFAPSGFIMAPFPERLFRLAGKEFRSR